MTGYAGLWVHVAAAGLVLAAAYGMFAGAERAAAWLRRRWPWL